MFTTYHFIWIFICILLGAWGIVQLKRKKPSLNQMLTIACVLCLVADIIKTFSMLQMVPSTDGSTMHIYMELGHLPLHLCSIQLIFVFYTRFAKAGKIRDAVLAFMYPSCVAGGVLAILIPTIFTNSIEVAQAFTHPLAYQYFLYHTMLFVLGVYIVISKEVRITAKHYLSSLGIVGALAYLSLYLNSMFAVPTYVDGELVAVDYATNFFFTHETPIGILLTEKWQWLLYFMILFVLVVVMLGLFYLPFIIKNRRNVKNEESTND